MKTPAAPILRQEFFIYNGLKYRNKLIYNYIICTIIVNYAITCKYGLQGDFEWMHVHCRVIVSVKV